MLRFFLIVILIIITNIRTYVQDQIKELEKCSITKDQDDGSVLSDI